MPMSDAEARIRRLGSRLRDAEGRAGSIEARAGRLAQDLAGFNQVGADFGGRTTTLNGKITGGFTFTPVPMPDCSLRVVGHATGIDYGTYAVPTGEYSLYLKVVQADTTLDLYPRGPASSPRFAGAPAFAYPKPINFQDVNAIPAIIPPAAPGYGYLTDNPSAGGFACQYPIGVLTWTESSFGTGTASVANVDAAGVGLGAGNFVEWRGTCFTVSTFAASGCPARANSPVAMSMLYSGHAKTSYRRVSSGDGCPALANCSVTLDGLFTAPPGDITSKTCPAVDLSTKFDCTWFTAVATGQFHNFGSRTVRFYEA